MEYWPIIIKVYVIVAVIGIVSHIINYRKGLDPQFFVVSLFLSLLPIVNVLWMIIELVNLIGDTWLEHEWKEKK